MSATLSPELRPILLTDMVDSTKLIEQLGDVAMGHWWSVHDRLARDLLATWRGREIDKTDGMLLLFDAIADAAGYALAFQRAVLAQAMPFAVRVGLHIGRVTLRANPPADVARGAKPVEVIGLALPMAARVMSVALGGQILLSSDAMAALQGAGGAGYRLQSQGHWQLQGVAEPVELFELGDDDTRFRPPRDSAKAHRVVRQGEHWLPLAELRHSLRAERDSFVGRADELHLLSDKLAGGARLVSVTGIGGTGKTRLVSHAAWHLLGRYPGGAWFCDLSTARTADGLLHAVAKGLDVALGSADPVQHLAQAIAGRGPCLVVLDNFEQVVDHAESTLGRWLDRAPQAQFVVTTRVVLNIAGEQILALAPLNAHDAAELFCQRAASARQGFVVGDQDGAAIEQLVQALDGLPLAIELAAARVRVLSPRSLLSRLRDRSDALFSRSAPHDRQATLRAAFDWSWDLLGSPERQALATLSVFEAGFSLDAAQAVIDAAAPGGPPMADLVPSLTDKSFVRTGGDDRFHLLQTVRDYAAGHLAAADRFPGSGPSLAQRVQAAHWQHFAGYGDTRATANRCADVNNLVAACRAATAAGDTPAATGCLVASWAALRLTGPYRVAVQLAQALAQRDDLAPAQRGLVHWVAADALNLLGDAQPAREQIASGLAAAADAGAVDCRARLLLVRGRRATLDGRLQVALQDLDEANRLAASLGDAQLQMLALNDLGLHMDHQARWSEARDCYERALAIARTVGDLRLEGGLLGNLGGLYHDRGQLDLARHHFEQALALAGQVGDRRWAGNAHSNLGLVMQEQGHAEMALQQFEQSLAIAREVGHVRLEYIVLCNLGILLSAQGRLDEGGRQLQQAVEAAKAADDRRAEGQFRGHLALNLARRGRIPAARENLVTGEQLLMAMADQLSLALLQCDRCELEWLAGHPADAQQALQAAQRMAAQLDCGPDSELGHRLAALTRLAAGTPVNR